MNTSTDLKFETIDLEEGNKVMREVILFFRDLIIILIIVLFIRTFFVTPFRINGSSMEMSYYDKEYILVDKFSYLNFPMSYTASDASTEKYPFWKKLLSKLPIHVGDPVRGDVVVITPHVDKQKEYYIKRIIAVPGDTIRFEDGDVLIKKSGSDTFIKISEPYLSTLNNGNTQLPKYINKNTFTLPPGHYWVMGDNRNNSADSRTCFRNCKDNSEEAHFIKRKDIIGKVWLNLGYYNIFGEGGLIESGNWKWTHPPRFLNHPKNASYPELGE